MRLVKKVLISGMLITGSVTLTSCDPPIPPEILASLAEQTYTCIEGQSSISGAPAMQDTLAGWADYLAYSCIDPEPAMTFIPLAKSDAEAKLEATEYSPVCKPALSVPLAIEASVLVYQESDVSTLNVSPESLAGILSGEITNWKQLAKENSGTTMPNRKILIREKTDQVALEHMIEFLQFNKLKPINNTFKPSVSASLSDYADLTDGSWLPNLAEGEMAILPNSLALQLNLYPANIYVGQDADGFPVLASPDVTGISTGATQWEITEDAKGLTVSLNPKKEPTPPDGSEEAPPAYQAIYPVNLHLCEADSLSRAIARFVLRLDNQGSLAVSNFAPLPEFVRIPSLIKVSENLPTPAVETPSQ